MLHFPKIDYLSISIPQPRLMAQWDLSVEHNTPFEVDDRTWRLSELIGRQTDWREFQRGGIFQRQIQFVHSGFSYFDGTGNTSLVQFSGEGCEYLRSEGILEDVCRDWYDRVTRLDIAIDITCDTTPEDFVFNRRQNRFKPSEWHDKESGTTFYVGSRTSDRFARVYRYRVPHPRSNELRVEYQLCDEQAKLTLARINETDILQVTKELGNTFGWLHPVYVQDNEFGKAPTSPRASTKGNTIFWLHKQVLPALRKSAEKGDLRTLIDFDSAVRAIIDEYENNNRR